MTFTVTKTYGHERGFSCCFRQHRALSHCSRLHGYALAFEIVFESKNLDENNWVIDFGSMDGLKEILQNHFDHKTAVAEDDPMLGSFISLSEEGAIDLVIFPQVGCESFAILVYQLVEGWLDETEMTRTNKVRVVSVKVSEHGSNSATYYGSR